MVDWSGGNRRRGGKKDCIWIAHGDRNATVPTITSPRSRTEAEDGIRALLTIWLSARRRTLVCADFAYGYPAGFAAILSGSATGVAPWRRVWTYLGTNLQDDIGTRPGALPSNRSNRFAVAGAINAAASRLGSWGPFWCLFKPGSHACVPQARPRQPFICGGTIIHPLRITDQRAQSDTPFRLFGTGSVGSQVLTGIPRLEKLRSDPELGPHSAVWPFETGWAPSSGAWLDPEQLVLYAEIYPSVRPPLTDTILDRGQVRAMWHWARDLDLKNRLLDQFQLPGGVIAASPDDATIRSEEGWILGCP